VVSFCGQCTYTYNKDKVLRMILMTPMPMAATIVVEGVLKRERAMVIHGFRIVQMRRHHPV
jgi:hypothetical protein